MGRAEVSERARRVYADALVSELTFSWGSWRDRFKALQRYLDCGFSFASLTVAGDRIDLKNATMRIGEELNRFDALQDRYVVARCVDDIICAKREGKLAVMLAFQGSNPLEQNLGMVRVFFELGVRWMLLSYNQRNAMGDGCHERTDSGLSRLGIALVKEMNRVGMIVDCSHTGHRTTMDILEMSQKPCIFSHSVCRALHDHERNIRDDQIQACARTGGLIGVNGVGIFLNAEDEPSVEAMYRHIDHITQLVGPRHIGLGLDLVYFEDEMYALYERTKETRYPNGYPAPPWHYFQPESVLELADYLLSRGYAEDDVRGILGDNFLRLASAVWPTAGAPKNHSLTEGVRA